MRVLVTGYSGLLGRHLARALRKEGYMVRALLHKSPILRREFDKEVDEVFWGSMDGEKMIRQALRGVQVVLHSAWAQSAPNSLHPTLNESATERLFCESIQAGVQGFVFISSVSVYGMTNRSDTLLDESSPFAEEEALKFIYPSEKIWIENILHAYEGNGIKLGIFRPGPIFDDRKGPCKKILRSMRRTLAIGIGSGHNHLPYIHADDVSNAIIKWIKAGKSGEVFNVTPSHCPTVRASYINWGKMIEQPVTPIFIRPVVIRLLSRGAKLIKKLLGKQSNADVQYAIASATRDLSYSNRALKAALDWTDEATAQYYSPADR